MQSSIPDSQSETFELHPQESDDAEGKRLKDILWKISSRDSSFSAEKLSNFKFLKEMLQQRVDGGWNQTKQNQSYRTKD